MALASSRTDPADQEPHGTEPAPDRGLRLEPVAGPPATAIEPGPEVELASIGRSQRSDFTLASETVSRDHAQLLRRAGRWLLMDLGSRHGTYVNAQPLEPRTPMVLGDGDLVRIGPYTFHVCPRHDEITLTRTIVEQPQSTRRVERVGHDEVERLARHRLDLLVDCAAMIHSAADEKHLAESVLQSALGGTGFHHAALLRPRRGDFGELEVMGYRNREQVGSEPPAFSRTLIAEASAGQVARLTETAEVPVSVSIAELGITAALCAPILLGPSVAAYLYLDARGHAAPPEADAAGFCQVIAKMCGLALANLKRIELERRHQALQAEITEAREAQNMILPAESGQAGPLRYAMAMRPGRFVAGDLFDVIPLDDTRTGLCIGDVTGEGVGAGVIMTATQAHLHGELRRTGDPLAAVISVNRYLADRLPSDKFVSLWLAVVDAAKNEISFVDAGHGHWLIKRAGARAGRVEYEGGILLGIEADYPYRAEPCPIGPGDRIILYSDGLVEQRADDNVQFGRSRVVDALDKAADPVADVQTVMRAIEAFAGRRDLDDDTTVASAEYVGQG